MTIRLSTHSKKLAEVSDDPLIYPLCQDRVCFIVVHFCTVAVVFHCLYYCVLHNCYAQPGTESAVWSRRHCWYISTVRWSSLQVLDLVFDFSATYVHLSLVAAVICDRYKTRSTILMAITGLPRSTWVTTQVDLGCDPGWPGSANGFQRVTKHSCWDCWTGIVIEAELTAWESWGQSLWEESKMKISEIIVQ